MSKRTVERHFENIKKKLGCENTGQIIPALIKYDCSLKKASKHNQTSLQKNNNIQ
ncbi:hypothetical protein PGH42_08170 [Legionella pneumophila]|nr:hypothetical protein PGH42_08170 [Legionella pneumophila]